MLNLLYYVVSIVVVLGVLVICHELGHFAVAKAVGIKVYEFSLGFGPKLAGWQRGGTRYNLRAFPLGGFVRLAGMDENEDVAEAEAEGRAGEDLPDEQSFAHKSIVQRMAVIAAGPIMNFILAIVLISSIFVLNGIPEVSSEIGEVLKGEPAAVSGLKAGDTIVAIQDKKVDNWESMVAIIQQNPQKNLKVTVSREKKLLNLQITPRNESGAGFIGIKPVNPKMVHKGIVPAVQTGTAYTFRITGMIVNFVGQMFQHKVSTDQLGGPVRIVMEISKAAESGLTNLIQLAAVLSINLGLFNLFPIPALDGSRIVFLLFEGLRGKPVDPAKENMVHLLGLALLLLLMVFVTFNDITQLTK